LLLLHLSYKVIYVTPKLQHCYTHRELKDVNQMNIEFFKYHGAGNDFILIDNRTEAFPTESRLELVQRMCSRKFGIGSDGLILIQKDKAATFYMEFYNPDGSQSFCGNGSRCAIMFASFLGMFKEEGYFISIHGENQFLKIDNLNVELQMYDVSNIEVGDKYYYMDTGSPHYIEFSDNLEILDINTEAKKIRYNERFSAVGTNVNYIQEIPSGIKVRTYERGVEDETLACGTGVTACAIAYSLQKNTDVSSVNVEAKGGKLSVSFEKSKDGYKNVKLTGPAKFVFKGDWNE
jgi:diaminopimelate epimerase